MGEELIVKLVEFIQTASPVVWAAARQQVTVQIFQNVFCLIVNVFLVGVCGLVFAWSVRKAKETYAEVWFVLTVFVGILMLLFVLIMAGCVNELIGLNMNPDYYAIKLLLELF